MKEPKIRFKGFKGEWEDPTIANTFAIRNGYTPSKAIKAFWDGGTIPWFRMEDIRENGGILKDAIQHITPLGVKGDGLFETNSIILATTATIGVHAMLIADSLANQQFTNFSIRKSLKDNYNPMFVYYSFFGIDEWCKKNTNSGGLLAVNIPYLLKQSFHTPILPEQQSIASYFQHLDALIQSTTKKIESLKQVKAASLQSMFPQEGETTPRVRFKGFEGEWETAPLGSLVNIYDGVHQTPNYKDRGIMFLSVEDISSLKSNKYISEEDFNQFYKVFPEKGDILMTRIGDVGTPNVVETNEKIAYYVSLALLKPKGVNSRFLSYCIQSHQFQKNLKLRTLTVAIPQKINKVEIGKVECTYSSNIKEQESIASYFTNLDCQISLQTQRLEKLKQIKSACLDNMFV